MIVQSYGQLQALTPPAPLVSGGHSGGSLDLYGATSSSYSEIYRTQPNVRIGVDFIARNVAQLGLHVFRRVSDTDRQRLPDHELAQWLNHPNPSTTRYRLIESLLQDLGIYLNAYWLKVRLGIGPQRIGLVRLPPPQMCVVGGLQPTGFVWTRENGRRETFEPSEIVYFGGYDPDNPLMGLSMLFTMRRILAEEEAAGEYRQSMWGNAARVEGIIQRPATAPKWTPTQRNSWREQWQSAYASGGSRPGSVAVLEDGMEFKSISYSAKDTEYVSARKLVREYCAASQHIPQPFVGILDHATFSNIREQHKNLYQDTLGPSLEMIQQEIERQLLIECRDQDDIYTEFNISEKLKGSFEEQAASLQILVGKPIMSANEGRARLNLPSTGDPKDDALAPQQGGPAAPSDATAPEVPAGKTTSADDGGEEEAAVDGTTRVINAMRQRLNARLEKLPVDERFSYLALESGRWRDELVSDLTPIVGPQATDLAVRVLTDECMRLETEAMYA